MAGSPPHEPTAETRNLVKLHVSVGTPQDMICKLLKITGKTLRKHYRDEIDLSTHQANAAVAGSLFNQAKAGNIAASIFWLKTRAGWKETQQVDHTSSDGTMSLNQFYAQQSKD